MEVFNSLKKGILYVLFANFITMLLNLITNFLLPRYLSIDAYAGIKTFQLYINYIGVFHLGYVDGIYLKYGGKAYNKIDKNDLSKSISTLRIFQLVITLLLIIVSILMHDRILLCFSFAIIPLNLTAYFRMLYQATGMFGIYSKIVNALALTTFLANCILLIIGIRDNYLLYLLLYVILDVLVWLFLEYSFFKRIENKSRYLFTFDYAEFIGNIRSGFALMMGNFTSFVLTGLDRWFVKFLLPTQAFALYSFAVSLENMLNMVTTPITIPLYNYFCVENKKEQIQRITDVVIIFSLILISAAFIVEIPVNLFLINYRSAMPVVFLLFAAQGIQFVIKAVFVNLYKVRLQQNVYMIKLLIVLISGAILNIVCYSIIKNMEAFAWGTFFSSVLWLILSIPDFKDLNIPYRNWVILLFIIAEYLILGFNCKPLIGFILHLLISLTIVALFFRNSITYIYEILNQKWRKLI